jgi:hypothetical protein
MVATILVATIGMKLVPEVIEIVPVTVVGGGSLSKLGHDELQHIAVPPVQARPHLRQKP